MAWCFFAAVVGIAAPARAADDGAERVGGRFGVSLLGGLAVGANTGSSPYTAAAGLVGPVLRFGGAFTDRFHLLGEFTLLVLPGGEVNGSGTTGFHAALNLAAQGYIGRRLFVRGGAGVGWASAVAGSLWFLPLPGPRMSGAVGFDVLRMGEQSLSVALETSYTFQFNAGAFVDRLFTLAVNLGFDWY